MSTVDPPGSNSFDKPNEPAPPARGLGLRWVIIAVLTAAAAVAGNIYGGPPAAITTGAAVATALHKLIA